MFSPLILSGSPAPAGPRPSLTLNGGRRDRLTFKAVGLSAQGCDGERTASYTWVHGVGGWDGMWPMDFLGHVRGEKTSSTV